MSELSIIQLPKFEAPVLQLTDEAREMIDNAVAQACLIGRVSNEAENKMAVDVQIEIQKILKSFEAARVAATKPHLDAQRSYMDFFKSAVEKLNEQKFRVGKLSTNYVQLVEAQRRAEENKRREELTRMEREREAALAQAKSHDERDIIQEHFSERARVEAPPPPPLPARAKGQALREDWDIVVTDVHLLARAKPSCVKIEPRLAEIKALLNAGVTVEGVIATKVSSATVRTPRSKTIDV